VQWLQDCDQLLTVEGVTAAIYARLAPYLTALPDITLINMNQASATLIAALSPALSLEDALRIVAKREELQGFRSFSDLNNLSAFSKASINNGLLTLSSQYFLSMAKTSVGDESLLVYDLLKRETDNNRVQIYIVWEHRI
jgi:general secretion pathway protein K